MFLPPGLAVFVVCTVMILVQVFFPAVLQGFDSPQQRILLLFKAFALAVIVSYMVAMIRKRLDGSVGQEHVLLEATSFPVLAAIPVILTRQDKLEKRNMNRIVCLCIIFVSAGCFYLILHG